MLNPITVPPKLLLRVLDELNALAETACRLPEYQRQVDMIFGCFEYEIRATREVIEGLL